jgi:hypothetical protein
VKISHWGFRINRQKKPRWIVMLASLLAAGCVAVVVEPGRAPVPHLRERELARAYSAPYARTMDVCTQLLKDLSMPIKAQTSDGVQTTIESERRDGTPTTLKVKIIGLDLTEVSVRTGVVGYWNRDLSMQFQEFIAQRLHPEAGAGAAPGLTPRCPPAPAVDG